MVNLMVCMVLFGMAFCGTVGNVSTIAITLFNSHLRTNPSNVLVIALAACDLASAAVFTGLNLANLITSHMLYVWHPTLCDIEACVLTYIGFESILILSAIGVEKYLCMSRADF